jgi:hypothetical protein
MGSWLEVASRSSLGLAQDRRRGLTSMPSGVRNPDAGSRRYCELTEGRRDVKAHDASHAEYLDSQTQLAHRISYRNRSLSPVESLSKISCSFAKNLLMSAFTLLLYSMRDTNATRQG